MLIGKCGEKTPLYRVFKEKLNIDNDQFTDMKKKKESVECHYPLKYHKVKKNIRV